MTYEFDAEKYRQASDTQTHWGREVIADLHLQGHEQILDLGCGDGRLTALLAEQVPQGSVLGIDASTNMIALAQKSFDRDNLRFACNDINEMDFCDRFDLVFSNAALHWIHDHQRLLKAIHRALHADGQVRTSFSGDQNCLHFKTTLREVIEEEKFKEALQNFVWPWFTSSLSEYEAIATTVPFSETRVWVQSGNKSFPKAEAMVAWLDQPCLVPFLDHLAPDLGRVFRNKIVDRMLERTCRQDGTFVEIFNRLHFKARKQTAWNSGI